MEKRRIWGGISYVRECILGAAPSPLGSLLTRKPVFKEPKESMETHIDTENIKENVDSLFTFLSPEGDIVHEWVNFFKL